MTATLEIVANGSKIDGCTVQLVRESGTDPWLGTDKCFGLEVSRTGRTANPFPWVSGLGYHRDAETGMGPFKLPSLPSPEHVHGDFVFSGVGSYQREIRNSDLDDLLHVPRLETLILVSNSIDDEAIPTLSRLSSLKVLRLACPGISDEGVRNLQATLVGCKIERDILKSWNSTDERQP